MERENKIIMYEDEIPVGKAENLQGKKFGNLIVLYRVADQQRKGDAWWKCKCDCGNEIITAAARLKSGKTKSCGCLTKKIASETHLDDLTGQKFNKLTVLYRAENLPNNKKARWHCKCDCGNEIDVFGYNLKSHHTNSCGCSKTEISNKLFLDDLTGKKFGQLLVLYRANMPGERPIWHCKCDCGNECDISGDLLKYHNKINCGCISNRKQSQGEKFIQYLLDNNNLKYELEKTFPTCRFPNQYHQYARFDFYVENKYLIEYDGEQHFMPTGGWNSLEEFKKTENNDKFKNQWCKDNHIPLIRIPYTHLNKLCIEDLQLETTNFLVT